MILSKQEIFQRIMENNIREIIQSLKGVDLLDIHSTNKKVGREKLFELSVKTYNQQENELTNLWNKRGIIWK